MDLTKLVLKWRMLTVSTRVTGGERPLTLLEQNIARRCADELDSALAAVPKDTVEALAAAASHWHDEMSDHRTDAPAYGQLRSAIRSVLAARPAGTGSRNHFGNDSGHS